jgi:SAM-dependent methyltransferase
MPGDAGHAGRYADAIHDARVQGTDAFQSWFDDSPSEAESVRRGFWDFAFHILTPAVVARIAQPAEATALEIGYGGGRLLNAAACFFGRAIGIDVHREAAEVEAFLHRHGRENTELLQSDGASIPVESGTVDLVYSFIVLQHLPDHDSFASYLSEARRVLRSGGTAQLYYGRLASRDPRRRYREIDSPVNHVSLELAPRHARRLARDAGFEVVDERRSFKRVPDGYPKDRGGQAAMTLAVRA